jgi:hypothetical protein
MIFRSTLAATLLAGAAIAGLSAPMSAQETFFKPAPEEQSTSLHNDYPTVTRADYIFGCMQVNGNTRDALEKCSCSIDVIASLLPHDKYVEAETVMSLRLRGGESVAQMQGPIMVAKVHDLKLAQIEGELRCF